MENLPICILALLSIHHVVVVPAMGFDSWYDRLYNSGFYVSRPPPPAPLPEGADPKSRVVSILMICLIFSFIIYCCAALCLPQSFVDRHPYLFVVTFYTKTSDLDQSLIDTFPTFVYSEVRLLMTRGVSLECAVCLNEFGSTDTLRVLPNCCHVFHPDCIQPWLSAHDTCPVCRSNVHPKPDQRPESAGSGGGNDLIVQVQPPDTIRPVQLMSRKEQTRIEGKQKGEHRERFTTKLPEEVLSRLVNSTSCVNFQRERSVRKGYRSGGEGTDSFYTTTTSLGVRGYRPPFPSYLQQKFTGRLASLAHVCAKGKPEIMMENLHLWILLFLSIHHVVGVSASGFDAWYDDDGYDGELYDSQPPLPPSETPSTMSVAVALVMICLIVSFIIYSCASICPPQSLDQSLIDTFPTFVYSQVRLLMTHDVSLECAVCLNEFGSTDWLRLLPNCCHVFHPDCIQPWLSAHDTCPVCRSNVRPKPGQEPEAYSGGGNKLIVCVHPPDMIRAVQSMPREERMKTRGKRKGEHCERFTTKLPEEVLSRLENSTRCVNFQRERSVRKGYRNGGEGTGNKERVNDGGRHGWDGEV
ncbi:hypothetical protein Vadar_008374 [Vaccinium darrowii]|uniref:Uncharacterized protein n=1 Tax=Vaccinium darrowii TaxID=229202 RepID=A0ACB7XY18_9ERIC|nr:hypothetical protein Vadar_008374 [Vaccinium darrowii]